MLSKCNENIAITLNTVDNFSTLTQNRFKLNLLISNILRISY